MANTRSIVIEFIKNEIESLQEKLVMVEQAHRFPCNECYMSSISGENCSCVTEANEIRKQLYEANKELFQVIEEQKIIDENKKLKERIQELEAENMRLKLNELKHHKQFVQEYNKRKTKKYEHQKEFHKIARKINDNFLTPKRDKKKSMIPSNDDSRIVKLALSLII